MSYSSLKWPKSVKCRNFFRLRCCFLYIFLYKFYLPLNRNNLWSVTRTKRKWFLRCKNSAFTIIEKLFEFYGFSSFHFFFLKIFFRSRKNPNVAVTMFNVHCSSVEVEHWNLFQLRLFSPKNLFTLFFCLDVSKRFESCDQNHLILVFACPKWRWRNKM